MGTMKVLVELYVSYRFTSFNSLSHYQLPALFLGRQNSKTKKINLY